MNTRLVRAIVRRDLTVLGGSRPVMAPLIILPLLFYVGLPLLMAVLPRLVEGSVQDVEPLIRGLPVEVLRALPVQDEARISTILLVYLLAPMFLIAPLMAATVIAADSVAGERERRTLEALLLSPVTDGELFTAKFLGAWLPAVTIAVLGGICYGTVSNLALAGTGEPLPFPNLLWTVLVLWVAPAVAAVALGAVVLISSRVKGAQEAYQIGGLLVLPLVGLIVGQSTGALLLGPGVLLAAGAVLWTIAALLLLSGGRAIRRERLGEQLR